MHADAFQIDSQLVRTLIRDLFADYSDLELRRLSSDGSDNVIYRLGADMCIRLPLTPRASAFLVKEVECIPKLPTLPMQIPKPLSKGTATDDYPSPWAIYQWIEGDVVTGKTLRDEFDAARRLAKFVGALQQADASDAPIYGRHNNFRGCPLSKRHDLTVSAIARVSDLFNTKTLHSVWEQSINLTEWPGDPVWVHGDIHAANLLMRDGELHAVIDFGLMGAGDPAVDLIVNWSLLSEQARSCFRTTLMVDEDTWLRGRGWALSTALIALAYYRNTNRYQSDNSMRVIAEVLTDCELAY